MSFVLYTAHATDTQPEMRFKFAVTLAFDGTIEKVSQMAGQGKGYRLSAVWVAIPLVARHKVPHRKLQSHERNYRPETHPK